MEAARQEIKENASSFRPITLEKVNLLLEEISENTGINFTEFPVDIVGPGDLLFDFQEVQTKLYKKIGGWNEYLGLLRQNGFSIPPLFDRQTVEQLRQLGLKEGVELDGCFDGFIYNLGGMKIMYTDIPEDRVIEVAKKYSQKEHEEIKFETVDQSKEYIKTLAEKYLSHEIGHAVYMHMLSTVLRQEWDDFVDKNEDLKQRVIEVQKDKHPNIGSIPIANEAFADIFSSIVVSSLLLNRLGKQEQAVALLKDILGQIGFRINESSK